jgi:hypothetical protein
MTQKMKMGFEIKGRVFTNPVNPQMLSDATESENCAELVKNQCRS